jgi:hypothetical protein
MKKLEIVWVVPAQDGDAKFITAAAQLKHGIKNSRP